MLYFYYMERKGTTKEKGYILDYESILIAVIYNSGGGITLKKAFKETKLAKKHSDKFKNAAKKLIAEKVICKDKHDMLFIKKNGKIFTAKVVSLSKNFGFISNLLTEEEYFVKGSALKGSIPGDTVLARETEKKSEDRSASAAVIAVLEYSDKLFGGVIVQEKNDLRVLPDKLGCPPLKIRKSLCDINPGDKVLFSIKKRGTHHSEHIADIESSFGSCETASACTDAYLAQNRIPVAFSAEASAEAEEIGQKGVDQKEFEKRLDLRDMPIFTIDGADTKDIDDAISIEKTKSGYLLGVHIADVSHYVRENTPLDNDAFLRGTSVYIADRVVPMLPVQLSNGVCSLNPGEDRLAFSCLMELATDGSLKKYKFKKSVIRSRVKGVYTEINSILDGTANSDIKAKYSEVSDCFPIMLELAQILKENRIKRGAPELVSTESKLICDENGVCTDVKERVQGVSESIIEEFMLAANNAAAKTAMKCGFPFVYRVHEKPSEEKLLALRNTLAALGINPLGLNKSAGAEAFAKLLENTKSDPRYIIINDLVLRSMSKAKYSEEPIGHFGLVMSEYAHFTSPIRRYSDLAVHRILSDYVKKVSGDKLNKKFAQFAVKAAQRATQTELSAVAAERSCEDYYTAEYMKSRVGEEYDGMISGVVSSGFFVRLENTVEGRVDIESLPEGIYSVKDGIALVQETGQTSYTIGDRLRVRCVAANINTGKIDFELISGQ